MACRDLDWPAAKAVALLRHGEAATPWTSPTKLVRS